MQYATSRLFVLTAAWAFWILFPGCAASREIAAAKEAPSKADNAVQPSGGSALAGRYQLVVVPGNVGNPFLVDTTTGCVWQFIQNEKTKRPTFIEADVENLHWGWGSGAQQILAAQIDSLNYPEDQKRILKQNLQKTECGQFNVTLTPETPRKTESAPDSKSTAPESK